MTSPTPKLPHESADLFITDGGLETTLVFLEGCDLPYFSAFDLLKDEEGYTRIKEYYSRYLGLAEKYKTAFILESPTWRASPEWLEKVGYPHEAIADINRRAIGMMKDLRNEHGDKVDNIIISGCVGPRGDGYRPGHLMTASEAADYHAAQISVFAESEVDLVTAVTMNYVEEAIGIVQAANAVNLPCVVSFTVETDGKLPGGMRLWECIEKVDKEVNVPPVYYMINCAHPTHFTNELMNGSNQAWTKRIRGIRANASCKSHAELDESTSLDRGNPQELGMDYKKLKDNFKQLNVFGGCCGTDEEHVLEIVQQVTGG